MLPEGAAALAGGALAIAAASADGAAVDEEAIRARWITGRYSLRGSWEFPEASLGCLPTRSFGPDRGGERIDVLAGGRRPSRLDHRHQQQIINR